MRRLTAFFALVFTPSLILLPTGQSRADLFQIVSPIAYADTEAPGAITAPAPSGRYQQIFPSSDFLSLPENVRTITQYAYRPDGDLTTPLQGSYTSLTVNLSTTSASPGSLSMTFADNIGPDEMLVFSGTNVDSSTENRGPAGGPKEFDMIITLQTPFEYAPSQGNLLMDVSFVYEGGFSTDYVNDAGTGGQTVGGNFGGSTAYFSAGGFVTQFTVVPEPSTITLFTMAGMVGAFVAWRKRKRT